MLAWRSHIDGAVNIVKTRGREAMCRTRMGSLLFNAVRHHLVRRRCVMKHCTWQAWQPNSSQVSRVLSSGQPLPFGIDWWMTGGDTESLFADSQRFALRYSELRAEANRLLANSASRAPESLAQIRQLARRVQSLDQEIATWLDSIPEASRPTLVCWVSGDDIGVVRGVDSYDEVEAFPGRVDKYPDFVTAMAWNVGRVSRLILASINIRLTAWLCSPVDYRTTPEYETSSGACEGIISDIIASVPYHLGWRRDGNALGKSGRSGFACGEEGTRKALPALFLMWSLTCVKNHDISTDEQRAWAMGRLKFIADEVGLKYANIVNQVGFSSIIYFCSRMISSTVQSLSTLTMASSPRLTSAFHP